MCVCTKFSFEDITLNIFWCKQPVFKVCRTVRKSFILLYSLSSSSSSCIRHQWPVPHPLELFTIWLLFCGVWVITSQVALPQCYTGKFRWRDFHLLASSVTGYIGGYLRLEVFFIMAIESPLNGNLASTCLPKVVPFL
jgi:hypothetical protein